MLRNTDANEDHVPLEQFDCLFVHILAVVEIQQLAIFLSKPNRGEWM